MFLYTLCSFKSTDIHISNIIGPDITCYWSKRKNAHLLCPLSWRHCYARLPSYCCSSLTVLVFCFVFFLQRDQGKEFSFSASFGSDPQQVFCRSQGDIWGLWSLLTACFCQSLCGRSVFVALGKAAMESQISNIWSSWLICICRYHFQIACHAISLVRMSQWVLI